MYTKAQFGKELQEELSREYNIAHLSRWAYGNIQKIENSKRGLAKK